MKRPFFSIIVPVYNVAPYLAQALDSVLAQQFTDYELLLIDDGSTDNSLSVCLDYARRYPQISVLHQSNGGQGKARNRGISLAHGQYCVFLDSDDYWNDANVLGDLAARLSMAALPDLILYGYQYINEFNGEVGEALFDCSGLTADFRNDFGKLIRNNVYLSNPWTKVIRTDVLRKCDIYFPEDVRCEDAAWSFELARHIHTYTVYNSRFYCYRIRKGSTSTAGTMRNITDLLKVVNDKRAVLSDFESCNANLYIGLFNYLCRQMYFLQEWLNLLAEQDRLRFMPEFEYCETVMQALAARFQK